MFMRSSKAFALLYRSRVSDRRPPHLILAAFGATMVATGVAAASQSGAPTKTPANPANPFQQQAAQLGVRKCAGLFTALGQTATYGSAYATQTRTGQGNPDASGVHAVAGMTYNTPDFRGQAAAVVMAAPAGQGCEGQLVRIAPYQRPCQQMVALFPAGSTAAGSLSGVPLYNLGGNQGQALLVPNGQTCVVVTVAQGTQRLQ